MVSHHIITGITYSQLVILFPINTLVWSLVIKWVLKATRNINDHGHILQLEVINACISWGFQLSTVSRQHWRDRTGSYDKLQQLQKYKREALEVNTMVTLVLVTMEIKYTYCSVVLLIHYAGMPCGLQIRLKARGVGGKNMIKGFGNLEGRQQHSLWMNLKRQIATEKWLYKL